VNVDVPGPVPGTDYGDRVTELTETGPQRGDGVRVGVEQVLNLELELLAARLAFSAP
jgi:hypothetical protein